MALVDGLLSDGVPRPPADQRNKAPTNAKRKATAAALMVLLMLGADPRPAEGAVTYDMYGDIQGYDVMDVLSEAKHAADEVVSMHRRGAEALGTGGGGAL
jgi:hypothetical protein